MKKFIIPIVLFIGLGFLLARGLVLNPSFIPSPLIHKPLPRFSLPTLFHPQTHMTNADFAGHVVLINIWASWCVSCQEEHPALMALAQLHAVPIIGLDYKDKPADGIAQLRRQGDPYGVVLTDESGLTGINWGIYGVPETFVIDKHGVIRHKYVGPLTPATIETKLLPLVRRLNQAS